MCQHRDPLHEGLVSKHAQLQNKIPNLAMLRLHNIKRGKIKLVWKYEKEGCFKGEMISLI